MYILIFFFFFLDNSDMIDEGYYVINAICSSNKFK